MDARGRVFDNIFTKKFMEDLKIRRYIYLKDYDNYIHAKASIEDYFVFYNHGRLHSALGYLPPAEYILEMVVWFLIKKCSYSLVDILSWQWG